MFRWIWHYCAMTLASSLEREVSPLPAAVVLNLVSSLERDESPLLAAAVVQLVSKHQVQSAKTDR